MHFLTIGLLFLPWFSPALGQGVQFASENGTYGIAAYFTEDGPSALSVCRQVGNQTCDAFRSAIASAIAIVLYDLTQPTANAAAAIAVNSPGALQKRVARTEADVREMLDAMGQTYDDVAIASHVDSTPSRRAASDVHISDAKIGNARYHIDSEGLGTGAGRVSVSSNGGTKRDATYSSSPGFKVNFENFPESLSNGTLQMPAQILTLCNLALEMANDWVSRTVTSQNGSTYAGIYGQNQKLITQILIIPEIRGYGLDQEATGQCIGSLFPFACRNNSQCLSTAGNPSGTCSPLSSSAARPTSSAAPFTLSSSASPPALPAYAISALLAELSAANHSQPETRTVTVGQTSTSSVEKPSDAPPAYQDDKSSSESVPPSTTSSRGAIQSSSGPACS